jgi:hypothetical protein
VPDELLISEASSQLLTSRRRPRRSLEQQLVLIITLDPNSSLPAKLPGQPSTSIACWPGTMDQKLGNADQLAADQLHGGITCGMLTELLTVGTRQARRVYLDKKLRVVWIYIQYSESSPGPIRPLNTKQFAALQGKNSRNSVAFTQEASQDSHSGLHRRHSRFYILVDLRKSTTRTHSQYGACPEHPCALAFRLAGSSCPFSDKSS